MKMRKTMKNENFENCENCEKVFFNKRRLEIHTEVAHTKLSEHYNTLARNRIETKNSKRKYRLHKINV